MKPSPGTRLPELSPAAESVQYLECEECSLMWRIETVKSLSGKEIEVSSFRYSQLDEWEYRDWPKRCLQGGSNGRQADRK